MLFTRRIARDFLNRSTLTDFREVVKEAKIPDSYIDVLDAKFIEGKSVAAISMAYGLSVESVNRIIAAGYDKVYNALFAKRNNK